MTAIQKGDELIEKFKPMCSGNSQEILNTKLATRCVIICVEEILNELVPSDFKDEYIFNEQRLYWHNVLSYLKSKK